MRIAIPFWNNRVSPVFDVARRLLLVQVEDAEASVLEERALETEELIARTQHLSNLGIETLICGAISRPMRVFLESSGVKIISNICGRVEEVVEAFIEGRLQEERYIMPGCTFRPEDSFRETQHERVSQVARSNAMRIAVTSQGPDLESRVDPRFGRSRYVIFANKATREITVQDNQENLQALQGAGIRVARDIVRSGAKTLITGSVGPKALEVLETSHVGIYVANDCTVSEALDQLELDQLETGELELRSKENAA